MNAATTETIFALSSGRPPAAIAVMRISGPSALATATLLAGTLPPFRVASFRVLREPTGSVLDHALVLAFRGPATATGEDLVEFHLHGGRAVVAAMEAALTALPGLRPARAGEFTRRALQNGRIDLAQAQGLADLLAADTEGERRAALAATDGAVGRAVAAWARRVANISARVEAAVDYSDEDDVGAAPLDAIHRDIATLSGEMRQVLVRPTVERLRDGALVVLAGPPNAGKSSLFNALIGRDAAIVTDIAGTTRDAIEASVIRGGHAYRLVDTAGLADRTDDAVEAIGMDRAAALIAAADLVLWFGDSALQPARAMQLRAKCDLIAPPGSAFGLPVSIHDATSVENLWQEIASRVAPSLIGDDVRLHEGQHRAARQAVDALDTAVTRDDPLIVAEHLRDARGFLGTILGLDATEAMLDALFAQFCVGK